MPGLFKAQGQIEASELPDPATRLALFGLALERLSTADYVYIGMDHFARSDDELTQAWRDHTLQRNFQGYSTHGECDIIGLGVSAISRIGNSYSQNTRDLPSYYAALDAGHLPVARGLLLNADDLTRRDLIGALMCHGEIDKAAFGSRHRLDFDAYFAAELARLEQLAADGLVELQPRHIRVTGKGRLLLRSIAMCFDAYLPRDVSTTRYSRAI